jgi:hypothetical protein
VPTSGGPNFRPRIAKSVEGDRAASRSAQLAMLAIKPSDIRSLPDSIAFSAHALAHKLYRISIARTAIK